MGVLDDARAQLRRLLARRREQRGEAAPTLGRLFGDTPGVRHPSDDPPRARLLSLEEWAGEDG